MASTSVSSAQKSFKYDVFLSFRGEDTRKTFVDHLDHALHQKGIITYKDDERMVKGERIDDQLLASIEDSRFHIIVFSENYASSRWCLEELVKIMKCQKTGEETAYPIFYGVEPTEVRNQSGAVGLAFSKHEKRNRSSILPLDCLLSIVLSCFNGSSLLTGLTRPSNMNEDTRRWRHALKEAASLAGMELKNMFNGHEAKFIEKVVEDISLKLHFTNFIIDEKLVGMKVRVENVLSLLEVGCDDEVRVVGIKGMGGIGKTTLARAVFDHISIWFEGKSFVENVREGSKGSGLKELQKQIISSVLNDQSIVVTGISEGKNALRNIFSSRKVLLVLDDVDGIEQLEALAGEFSWFKRGSRIIVTTRDERVLIAHGVNFTGNFTHDISLLTEDEAICLFSKYAFGRNVPNQGYEQLSREVARYAKGLPLTIKILGSDLCGRTKHEWKDAIQRLEAFPENNTLEILELSYIGLKKDEKEIFLDVACILKGQQKDKAIKSLKGCGYYAEVGLKVLEEKSLIFISDYGRLLLHDLVEEMARNIVRHEHPDEPWRHSRLWILEEIKDILVNDLGTEETKSISLKYTDLHLTIIMQGLRKMMKLRLLDLKFAYSYTQSEIDGANLYLPNTLQTLRCSQYCHRFLPTTFQVDNLVNLEIHRSNICQLWEREERNVFKSLRFLRLSRSNPRTFDLGLTPKLEELDLGGCVEFAELLIPVESPKLKHLNLSGSKLSNLNLGLTPNLEKLILSGCYEFAELRMPVECPKLKHLNLSGSKLSNLNLGLTPNLEKLILDCSELTELCVPVECPNLKLLILSSSELSNLNLELIPNLEWLNISGSSQLVELRIPVKYPNLEWLNLHCSALAELHMPVECPNLYHMDLGGCSELVELHMPVECPNLYKLELKHSKLVELHMPIGCPNLTKIDLTGCSELAELHLPVKCPNLTMLDLTRCSKLAKLQIPIECPRLHKLDLKSCFELAKLCMPVECPNLMNLDLKSCSELAELRMPVKCPHLHTLDLECCSTLTELHMPVECPDLYNLCSKNCSQLVKLHMPIECPNLYNLDLIGCSELATLHMPVECPNLYNLDLMGCSKLETLLMPVECPNLYKLDLMGCSKLATLLMPIECPNLYKVDLHGCFELVEFRMPIECPKLKNLDLIRCSELAELRMPVVCSNLYELDLRGCSGLVELQMPVECPNLYNVILEDCSKLAKLHMPVESPSLYKLNLNYCSKLRELCMPAECPNLCGVHLNGCSELAELHMPVECPNLYGLHLSGCSELVELHMPVECPRLKILTITDSKLSNLNLELTPNLKVLDLQDSSKLVELRMPVECPNLVNLFLGDCSELSKLHMPVEFPQLKFLILTGSKLSHLNLRLTPNLAVLNLRGSSKLVELRMPVECPNLLTLFLEDCSEHLKVHMPLECPKLMQI